MAKTKQYRDDHETFEAIRHMMENWHADDEYPCLDHYGDVLVEVLNLAQAWFDAPRKGT